MHQPDQSQSEESQFLTPDRLTARLWAAMLKQQLGAMQAKQASSAAAKPTSDSSTPTMGPPRASNADNSSSDH